MVATILRSEVLRQLETGEPFKAMEFVKCDRTRGTGGELVELRGWSKMKGDAVSVAMPLKHRYNAGSRTGHKGAIKVVNLHNPANRLHHPIGVHLLLMITFNGKRILNG